MLFSAPFPIRIERAEGALLFDVDGHNYTDFLGDFSAGLFGHSHPTIVAAISDAIAIGLNIGANHVAEVEFAELIADRFKLEMVRLTNSGTEANLMAIAAARSFTGRPAVMVMRGGYHGGALHFNDGGSPVNAPFEFVVGCYNEAERTRSLLAEHGDRIAAVIFEPMLGSGGCIPATPEFVEMLQLECASRGVLLICDEVMTSRLGPAGMAGRAGILPDLVTLGKYIGGGMNFGAFGGRSDIMRQFDPSIFGTLPHAGTFNNNTITMRAGIAALREVFSERVCLAHNARGEALKATLNAQFAQGGVAIQITGYGSLLSVHPIAGRILTADDVRRCDSRLRRLIYFHLLESGVYLAERGYMGLSLCLTDAHFASLIAAFADLTVKYRDIFAGT